MCVVVLPEEEPPGVVGQGDPLAGHLEVNAGGHGRGGGRALLDQGHQLAHGLGQGGGSRQRVRVHGEEIEDVAGGAEVEKLLQPGLITGSTFPFHPKTLLGRLF